MGVAGSSSYSHPIRRRFSVPAVIAVNQGSASWRAAPSAIALAVGLLALYWTARLVTLVQRDGLLVQFKPIHFSPQRIDLSAVESLEPVTYSPLSQYGGWGIRYDRGSKAYNASGNQAVRLTMRGGGSLRWQPQSVRCCSHESRSTIADATLLVPALPPVLRAIALGHPSSTAALTTRAWACTLSPCSPAPPAAPCAC
jgi:hypothetical protein